MRKKNYLNHKGDKRRTHFLRAILNSFPMFDFFFLFDMEMARLELEYRIFFGLSHLRIR